MRIAHKTLIALLAAVCLVECSVAHSTETLSFPHSQERQECVSTYLVGSAFLLASVAAMLDIESDREYSRYLETAHPTEMRSHYDRAEGYRNLSNMALLGAEVLTVAVIVISLRGESKDKPEAGNVRISFATAPLRAEVTLKW